jgi:hypothetical protein
MDAPLPHPCDLIISLVAMLPTLMLPYKRRGVLCFGVPVTLGMICRVINTRSGSGSF